MRAWSAEDRPLDSDRRHPADAAFDDPSGTDARSDPLSWHTHGTLLVVDDDPAVREVMTSLLGRCGFTVLTAHDGRSAMELFRRRADDIRLAFIDFTLPDTDGEAVFRSMRELRPELRAVLCSGSLTDEVVDEKCRAGWATVVRKPFHLVPFLRTIRMALGE
ncbi:MAG: response regulator [Zetaproteobacteria bacterium]|nr:MAG: response regulator [Zetaproteobacteria bacterium]